MQFRAEASGEKVLFDGAEVTVPASQNQVEIIKVGHYTLLTHATLGFKVKKKINEYFNRYVFFFSKKVL